MVVINLLVYFIFVSLLYFLIGPKRIFKKLEMFFDKSYWNDYNTIEFAAWMAKAAIIIPGLVYGKEIWWLHFFTLCTSSLLIWASMRKSLPTLIVFNTLWIGISITIILRNIL
jgi:hypothetical protein